MLIHLHIDLHIVLTCFCTTTELSSCHREYIAHKAKSTYYLTLKGIHLLVSVLGQDMVSAF